MLRYFLISKICFRSRFSTAKNLSSPHSLSGDMTGRLSRKHDSLVYLSHETDGRAFLTKFIANITDSVCAYQISHGIHKSTDL